MAKILSVSIDVTKLDKTRFYKGQKGTYANLQISVNDEPDQYGNDCSVWESQSKEERDAKKDRNFVGNGKIVWSKDVQTTSNESKPEALQFETIVNQTGDDLPF